MPQNRARRADILHFKHMKKTNDNTTNKNKYELSLEHSRINFITDLIAPAGNPENATVPTYITILCTKGHGELTLNGLALSINKNDMLVCAPGDIVESKGISDDFESCGFALSKQFYDDLTHIPLGLLNTRVYISEHPVMTISEHAAHLFIQYYELIRSKLSAPAPTKHHQLVTDLLLEAFMYEFHDALEITTNARPVHFTSGDNLFKQFLELILQSHPKPRSVVWYADQLNVTPKYLSCVTKQCSGETASTIINRYVLEDVKRNLKRPEKSIKEIVCELDFPSISFFGKYVKKHLGVAPKYYRQNLGVEI